MWKEILKEILKDPEFYYIIIGILAIWAGWFMINEDTDHAVLFTLYGIGLTQLRVKK